MQILMKVKLNKYFFGGMNAWILVTDILCVTNLN